MEQLRFRPKKLPKSRWIDAPELRILPMGDFQYAGEDGDTDVKRLRKYVDFGIKNDFYFIGVGDYTDFASPSNRAALHAAGSKFYDSTFKAIDKGAEVFLDELKEILEPTIGRWIHLLRGHHYFTFSDGTDTDYRLAEFLNAPFGGDCALVTVEFSNGRKVLRENIWSHHGAGGGMTIAAPLNRLQRMAGHFDARVFITGHQHKQAIAQIPRIGVGEDRKIFLISIGGLLRGYQIGRKNAMGIPEGGYPEKKMLVPVSLGFPSVYMRPIFAENRVDITAEET